MKKIFKYSLLMFSGLVFSQVAIGKSGISVIPSTTTPNPGVSLEFGNIAGNAATQKGILVPRVSTVAGSHNSADGSWNSSGTQYPAMTTTTNGTIIFDLYDYKMKYKIPTGWFDLTVKNKTDVITGITNNVVNTTIQDAKSDSPNAKVSIGVPVTPSVPGILVLEEDNKAMVLPTVDKYSSVIAPSAGMMVYDLANNMLCVYNGSVWSFWKP